jgi:hypothetical protein
MIVPRKVNKKAKNVRKISLINENLRVNENAE